ncbi:hypothetical protein FBU30_000409, partial [Linnemannia zychae]
GLSIESMVKILRVDARNHWDLLYLLRVMDALPCLEELCVEPQIHDFSPRYLRERFFTQEQEDQRTGSINGGSILGNGLLAKCNSVFLKETRIRTLVVYGAALTIPAMEAVIHRCPMIEIFKFVQTTGYIRATGKVDHEFRIEIWPHLRNYCTKLHEIHFSRFSTRVTALEFDTITSFLPNAPPSTFISTGDFQSLPEHKVPAVLNQYSILAIRFDRTLQPTMLPSINILHKILCSCPNLVVFTALSIGYFFENMDVNNLLSVKGVYRNEDESVRKSERPKWKLRRERDVPDEELPTDSRPVWVCRNLRTLHLFVTGQGQDNYTYPISLVIFGYLSLVCPRLEQLHLKRELSIFEDEGGVCLLGRLKHLKRLQFHSIYDLSNPDIFWLRRRYAGHAKNDKEMKSLVAEIFTEDTLLGRIIQVTRSKSTETDLLSALKACLKKLSQFPAFQVRKPFITEDRIDLGGVGRPDDLLFWVCCTNRDLIGDVQFQEEDTNHFKQGSWDEAFLPELESLYFLKDSASNETPTLQQRFIAN